MELIAVLLFWIVGAVFNGLVAERRRNSVWGAFLLSLLVSPLLVYLYMLATPAPSDELRQQALLRALTGQ